MRHRNSGRKLNIKRSHKSALMRSLAVSLLRHGVIKTTVPKAKEARVFVEPLITLARKNTLASRRLAFDRLRDRSAVLHLFDFVAPKYVERTGGYTMIVKCGFRVGDNAPMAFLGLV